MRTRPDDSSVEDVLILWGVGGIGGTEQRFLECDVAWRERGLRVRHLMLVASTGDLQRSLLAQGAAVEQVSISRALQIAIRDRPRVLIAPGLKASLIARLARLIRREVVHIMPRNGLDFRWGRRNYMLDRASSPLVDLYLTNSIAVAEHLKSHRYPSRKIETLTSALPDEWYRPRDPEIGSRRKPVVLMVGNNRPEKNQEFGVRAFIGSGLPGVLRVFTNDGQRLRALWETSEPGPGRQLEIVEGKRVTPADYDSVGVLLHPSVSESLPRAVLEAQARGIPVVAGDVGDTRRIVSSGSVLSGLSLPEWSAALVSEMQSETGFAEYNPVFQALDVSTYSKRLLEIARQ